MIQTGPTTSLIPKSSEQTELTLDNSIINFNNEITVDGEKRIRFFERRHPFNKELIEYAYITKEDKNIIHFVNNDFTYYPKNKINEFIINLYARKNKEVIKKHKTSNLHFIVKISGINIPVIFYMLLTKTWDQTFKFLNIQYNEDTKKTGDYHIVFNNTIVNMNPTTLRDKYIVNGLLTKKAYFKGIDFKKDDTTLLDIMLMVEVLMILQEQQQ